jgi:hypothetical protein
MVTAGAEMINGLINGIQARMALVPELFNKITSSSVQTVQTQSVAFNTVGGLLMTRLTLGISGKKSAVLNAVQSCVTAAANAIRNRYYVFYNAGEYMVDGFAEGIDERTWLAEATAASMATAAEEAAREALGIESPSKVFRALGCFVPEGFAVGIDKMSGLVNTSVTDMTDGAINSVKDSISKLASAINTDIDSQPTIRPVLDLSDVRSGAAAIGGLFDSRASVGVMANVGAISSMMNSRGQNGGNDDVVSAINKLGKVLGNSRGDTYQVNGVTYDDGSNVATAVKEIIRAARTERRV